MTLLRNLLWAYLGLLIFEGALRKWVVPALDAPLLIIRDPLVLWIYYQAWKKHLSFSNSFAVPTLVLAIMTAIISTLFGWGNVLVTIYGLRTDYLQIPLIFLIPQILNRDDVIAMGRFFLYLAVPITALVILQFRSPPDSWWNKGTLANDYGTVRPSGPFSFVAGLGTYYSLTAAFVMYGYLEARTYKIWLLAVVTFAVLIASACSGSRTCLALIGLVVVVAIMCVITRGKGGMGIIVAAVLIALAVSVLSSTPLFQEATEQLNQRIEDAGKHEGGTEGFFGRFVNTMLAPLLSVGTAPIFGYGLGLGTNAGIAMSHTDLYWPEEEWARLIFECGPIFGIVLCIYRTVLALTIAKRAFQAFRRDNVLPILIFAACGLLILNGQWGVPTTLGYAIFGAGLILAACVDPLEWHDEDEEHADDQAEDESEHSKATDTVG
jgi:hypothetical protein